MSRILESQVSINMEDLTAEEENSMLKRLGEKMVVKLDSMKKQLMDKTWDSFVLGLELAFGLDEVQMGNNATLIAIHTSHRHIRVFAPLSVSYCFPQGIPNGRATAAQECRGSPLQ